MEAETLFKLFMGGLGLCLVLGILAFLTGHLKFDNSDAERAEEEARRRAESMAAMSHRAIVSDFVQRRDFVHLSQEDFEAWLETNKGHVFPHEIEAMKRQHAAHRSAKQPHPRRN